MYLKSIEIHGFKSFANKILFEFQGGITAIVGPNGSGKSNVADAVRWVLGEQSAKQLRGSSMQDVIFSGSEARKPMGYASVEITFDNSDHKLAIDYEEVSVARRVYRSGESGYLINGNLCRLKDVQELFMDTGIGKEGYSIIGQGQIDKILSTKPEDRRELFDEAAGIVKFKKRKNLAERNLFEATENLLRVNDIIVELEKQVGPLEKQSLAAKEYLLLKENLKVLEVNNFLKEYEDSGKKKEALDEKCRIAEDELNETKNTNEKAESEYRRLDGEIANIDNSLNELKSERQNKLIEIEKNEGEIKVIENQLESLEQENKRITDRIGEIESDINDKYTERAGFEKQNIGFLEKKKNCAERKDEAAGELYGIRDQIATLSGSIEESNGEILDLVNKKGQVRTNIEHVNTLVEQSNIRKAELTANILKLKNDEAGLKQAVSDKEKNFRELSDQLTVKEKNQSGLEKDIQDIDKKRLVCSQNIESLNREYLGIRSKLEALIQIAERYEGYSTPVKKLMEKKDSFPGICGVVADLVSSQKKYEIAVETALGASIQHIVTEDEKTAKDAIEYLKREKLGRATFLPITSIGDGSRGKVQNEIFDEKGVIGDAASLTTADEKYAGIVKHLLMSFIVVDTIDNALSIAKKYNYSIRLVTLEGELLSPGGSIAGGAYRNKGNLLGRKRDIEELEAEGIKKKELLEKIRNEEASLKKKAASLNENLKEVRESVRKLGIEKTSAGFEVQSARDNHKKLQADILGCQKEVKDIEAKSAIYRSEIEKESGSLSENDNRQKEIARKIEETGIQIAELKKKEEDAGRHLSEIELEYANIEQASKYTLENITRIDGEIERLKNQKESIIEEERNKKADFEEKRKSSKDLSGLIIQKKAEAEELEKSVAGLAERKEQIKNEHKEFFDSWSQLTKKINELEKEALRLQTQRDKLGDILDASISYMWDEYQLTVTTAEEYRDENFKASSARKDINECRQKIKMLGDVNVNAIEDYKNVSERYKLMTAQRDDLNQSKANIEALIKELDEAMRKQFAERFEQIRQEFNVVFRELFGGGKGELELLEDEDMLEAGIRIIAQPPGKKLQNMMQLSGGEKALTAISLLFAIQNLKPSPFCLLDEIEAALDDSNVKRYASYLHKLTKNSQFIVITHRRGTMASADTLYGITMQEKGVSTLVSVNLIEDDLDS